MAPQHGSSNVQRARNFLLAIEGGGDAMSFFHPDAVHRQMPNLIYPDGVSHDVPAMAANAERGRKLLSKQTYEVSSAVAEGDRVVLEVTWRGTLAMPLKHLPEGAVLVAHCAMVFVFEGGLIRRQTNYDCYERF